MKKPVFGLLLGGFLGIFDGLSALVSAPETAPQIGGIVIGSTIKGLLAGVLIGWYARKKDSLAAGVIFGGAVGLFLAFGWESAIPFLPGWIKSLTVRYHLTALVPADALPPGVRGGISPPDILPAVVWLVGGAVLALVLSVWLFARRDYP